MIKSLATDAGGADLPAPPTIEQVLDRLRQTKLVADSDLAPYLLASPGSDGNRFLARLVGDGLLTSYQARRLLEGNCRQFYLGNYKILEPIGQGLATVFLAEHRERKHRVALKVLQAHKVEAADVARFYREAQALTTLRHPNIIGAYEIDRVQDRLFLAMEYLQGTDLQQLVDGQGPMDVFGAIDVIRQSALGLGFAHAAGWVHRDIKPSNLLLCSDGTVKVLDLGLACLSDDQSNRVTEACDLLGTADYLAPEQSLDSRSVDGRADIYSLGATFYFLLTGHPPFDGGSALQKIARHHGAAFRPVRVHRPEVPPQLESALERMLAKNPRHRYQTADELIAALGAIDANRSVRQAVSGQNEEPASRPRGGFWKALARLAGKLLGRAG